MKPVTITIDGRPVSVESGTTVLEAAIEHGVSVPYYCYHPALGVGGSCRVCIVKIEKMPKLQTACSTVCADGMVVHTHTPDVVEARAGVFEFLLINHPLDCPVCDKGGECPLQDFSYTFGREHSRMDFPRRVFDGKGVKADVDFGPTLFLNRNRCILCTRCVRFMRDIDGDAQISIVDRGYGSEIATFQEEGVHSLLSGNLMDICPVGAITTKDYRFKSRPWDNPQAVDTICTLCSKGCSTTAWLRAKPEWAKGPRLARFTPRLNPAVNGYWMCDIGRFDYHWIESEHRLRRPLVRRATGMLEPVDWHDLLGTLRERIDTITTHNRTSLRFLISAHAGHEEIFLFRRLAGVLTGGDPAAALAVSWRYREKLQPKGTTFQVPAVDAPNVDGARDWGLRVPAAPIAHPDVAWLQQAVGRSEVAALYVFDPGPPESIGDISWVVAARRSGDLPLLIVQGVVSSTLTDAADFVLPGTAAVEKDVTFTNDRGNVQAASRVLPPPGDAMEDWQILINVATALGVPLAYTSSAHIRGEVAAAMADKPPYAELTGLSFARPVSARNWLEASNPSERWKWDLLFQDLPPVKFAGEPPSPARPDTIPLIRKE